VVDHPEVFGVAGGGRREVVIDRGVAPGEHEDPPAGAAVVRTDPATHLAVEGGGRGAGHQDVRTALESGEVAVRSPGVVPVRHRTFYST
jgi:hypothetical protein